MIKRDKEFYARSNRILEKLASSNLSGYDLKYCIALYRKTFGYGKYEDRISRSQISSMTGILEVHVSRAEKRLKDKNIIHVNSKAKGFNLNNDQWEKVPGLVPFKKVPGLVLKGTNQADKKGTRVGTYKETTKKLTKEGAVLKQKMTRKEIDKLEGKPWLKAIMEAQGRFNKRFIERFLSMAEFTPLYDAWYELGEAFNVKDPCAWLIAKVERGSREED